MTPAAAGASAADALAPAAPAGEVLASPTGVDHHSAPAMPPAPAAAGARPTALMQPLSKRVVLARTEVQELCDVLWQAELALRARGWQCLGQVTGAWVGLLEERLWAPDMA